MAVRHTSLNSKNNYDKWGIRDVFFNSQSHRNFEDQNFRLVSKSTGCSPPSSYKPPTVSCTKSEVPSLNVRFSEISCAWANHFDRIGFLNDWKILPICTQPEYVQYLCCYMLCLNEENISVKTTAESHQSLAHFLLTRLKGCPHFIHANVSSLEGNKKAAHYLRRISF